MVCVESSLWLLILTQLHHKKNKKETILSTMMNPLETANFFWLLTLNLNGDGFLLHVIFT